MTALAPMTVADWLTAAATVPTTNPTVEADDVAEDLLHARRGDYDSDLQIEWLSRRASDRDERGAA